jgi:hypothetical protein
MADKKHPSNALTAPFVECGCPICRKGGTCGPTAAKAAKTKPERIDACPHCGVSLIGEPIPEKWRDEYYGGSTHYRREIGIVDRERDRTTHFQCPDCGKTITHEELWKR